jgi:hypothetical protein
MMISREDDGDEGLKGDYLDDQQKKENNEVSKNSKPGRENIFPKEDQHQTESLCHCVAP